MTLDGVNIQDNTLKTTDGFFALVSPRIDAIEEITFSTAASGAENTGSGATQIRYTTKSGTNQFRGGVFHQYRSDALNTNTWFNKRDNLPKTDLLLNQPGFSLGGPVRFPGFDGRNKAFFFVNYEESRSTERHSAQPHDPAPGRAGGQLPLQRGGRSPDGQPLRARRAQRPDRDARSADREAVCRHPQRHGHGRQRPRPHRSAVPGVFVPGADAGHEPVPDIPRRLPGDRAPPAHLFAQLPVHRRRAGHHQQPRELLSRLPGARPTSRRRAGPPAAGCGRSSVRRWSTSSASAMAARP